MSTTTELTTSGVNRCALMRRDVTALNASCVAARSENVDTGRYSMAYEYMRLSQPTTSPRATQMATILDAAGASRGSPDGGGPRREEEGMTSSGAPADCASVTIHRLLPPEL